MNFPQGLYKLKNTATTEQVAVHDGTGNYYYIQSTMYRPSDKFKVEKQGWWKDGIDGFNKQWEPYTKLQRLLLGIDTQDKTE